MEEFDDATPFCDRSGDEIWYSYADSHERAMRDAVVGYCEAAHDEQFQPRSQAITRRQFFEAYDAISFANFQGAILNVKVTIAWAKMGYRYGQEVDAAFRLLMQAQRKFLRRSRVPNFCYTVFERSETFGLHSHSGVCVPAVVYPEYRQWLDKYVERLDRIKFRRRLHVRFRNERMVSRAIDEQWRWFRYCMKGLDPYLHEGERELFCLEPTDTFGSCYKLNVRYTGIVTLQRLRLSQDMLSKARQEVGYLTDHRLVDSEDRYTDCEYRRGEAARLTEMLRCELP